MTRLATVAYGLEGVGRRRGLRIEKVDRKPDGSITFTWSRMPVFHQGRIDAERLQGRDGIHGLADLIDAVIDELVKETSQP